MQHRLLRQEFWTADTRQSLREKIEQSNGQTSHYGPAMVAVFRGLIAGEQAEGTARATNQSSFHTETEPFSGIILNYKTITTARTFRNTSQEVSASRKLPTGVL